MKSTQIFRRRLPWPILLSALMISTFGTGCSSWNDRLRGDKAFITYWPPVQGSTDTRLAIKDNINMAGVVTTAGSKHFAEEGQPAQRDAACLEGVRRPGVHIVGKTNLTEFALGASGLNEYFGTPKNRLNRQKRLMPGGSSSGSAVAVATGKADIAIGTDTAGSIRTPAACCGIYGLKTTFGLISLKGVFPISPEHLDTVGPLARDIPHLVEGMDLLKPGFRSEYESAAAAVPNGQAITVGRLYLSGTDTKVDEAVDRALQKAGFRVVRLNPAFEDAWKQAKEYGQVIAVGDSYKNDRQYLDDKGVSPTTKLAILLGEVEHDGKKYGDALAWKNEWQKMLRRTFEKVDFIALPTLQSHPLNIPIFGRLPTFEARALALQNTVPVNYAGNPAVAIPIPMDNKRIPITSLQLIGPPESEADLLNAGRILASKGG